MKTKVEKTDLKLILGVVAEHHGVFKYEIFQKVRIKEIVEIRQEFHYLARKHNPMVEVSLSQIGRVYSNITGISYEHSTVLNSIKKIESLMDVYESVAERMELLSKQIEEKKMAKATREKKLNKRKDVQEKYLLINNNLKIMAYQQDINNQTQ